VARQRGQSRRSGAFMDSVLDRVADMILCSCLFWRLAADGQTAAAVLALITLVVSIAVSHVRAEAEAAKVVLTEGLFQRLERVIALVVGLLVPGAMVPVLGLLAVLGTATVLQRSFLAVRGA
jgi:CDP-diacylglycerol---glycerol-3-phosphate 3-phosphatidyltransferase